jgi:PAS domain S-box-containing protein
MKPKRSRVKGRNSGQAARPHQIGSSGDRPADSFPSEQTLRLAFDNSPTGIAVIDTDYRFHSVNSSFCELFGYSEAQLLQKSFIELTHSGDVEKELLLKGELLRGEIPSYRMEKRIVTATGAVVWLDHTVLLERAPDGAPLSGLVMVEDITNHNQTEEEWWEDEGLFHTVAETTPIGFYIYTDEQFVYVNPAIEAITGYSRDELLKMKVLDAVHPSMREQGQQRLMARSRGEVLKDPFEFMILTKSGEVRWAYSITNRIKYRGNYSFLGALFDITERKQAEAALKAAEDRYRSFIANSSEAIWCYEAAEPIDTSLPVDVQIELIFKLSYLAECNDAMARFCGFSKAADVTGKRMSEIVKISEPANIAAARAFVEDGYMLHEVESVDVDAQGQTKYYLNSIAGIVENGFLVRAWGTHRDITERKQAEDLLKTSHQNLRDLAARLQTIREKERTSIARDLHDVLGQALTGLKMDTDWLKKKLPHANEEEVRSAMAERLDSVTDYLDQTLTSVKNMSSELRPRLLDAFGLTAAVEWECQEFQRRTGISTECPPTPDDPRLEPDRATAIYRILQESLTNVARHSGAGKVIVTVKATNDQVVLTVKDDGKGIPGIKVCGPKSLGLLGMHERALMLGGDLTVESEPGMGTTVTARIPINDAESKASE